MKRDHLVLALKPELGMHRDDAIAEAIRIAVTLGVCVKVDCNGQEFRAFPGDTPDDVRERRRIDDVTEDAIRRSAQERAG